jgi:cytochrome c-type biogenesis protein CcmH/NrfG
MREQLAAELSGRYEIERQLGRGGMATVWLARDLKHDRHVAIKLLHAELAGAIAAERFVREVRVTARLQHPGIVPVLDSGILNTSDGVLPWYAMPFISGESLRVRIQRETQLAVDESIRITRDVAGTLAEAHRHGVVHRDIKHENIMLDGERVYVVDFGIAKALLDTGDERLTSTGLSIGTAIYMSPEQASGGGVDGRSDEYSLATVLYEMLTGEAPFAGANAQAVVARRFAEAARPMRHVRSTISPALEQVVLKALERTPADRYVDITTFAKQLDPDRVTGSSASHAGRRSRLTLAIAVGVVGLVAGLWAVFARPMRAKKIDPALMALYTRGTSEYDKRTPAGVEESIRLFKSAIAKDSSFALGWVGLGKSYTRAFERAFIYSSAVRDSVLRLALSSSDRGLALDSSSAEAWTALAAVTRLVDPTDVTPSIRAARKALSLDSANNGGWHFLAMGLAESGDLESGLKAWSECVRRNPKNTQCIGFLSQGLYWHKQFEEGLRWADSAVALDPNYLFGRASVGLNAIELGRFPLAIASLEAAHRVSTEVEVVIALANRAMAEARSGDLQAARSTVRAVDSLAKPYMPPAAHSAVWIAEAHAEVGDGMGAIWWLRQYPNRADLHYQIHLRCDPPFEKLAQNPEYKALLLASPTGC